MFSTRMSENTILAEFCWILQPNEISVLVILLKQLVIKRYTIIRINSMFAL